MPRSPPLKHTTECKGTTIHALCCHWLATSAAFTAKVPAWSTAQVSWGGGRRPLVTFPKEYNANILKLPSFETVSWCNSCKFYVNVVGLCLRFGFGGRWKVCNYLFKYEKKHGCFKYELFIISSVDFTKQNFQFHSHTTKHPSTHQRSPHRRTPPTVTCSGTGLFGLGRFVDTFRPGYEISQTSHMLTF